MDAVHCNGLFVKTLDDTNLSEVLCTFHSLGLNLVTGMKQSINQSVGQWTFGTKAAVLGLAFCQVN